MTDFDTDVPRNFVFKWSAQLYAWRAERAGYKATIRDDGDNWFENGGGYTVILTKKVTT